MRRALRAAVIIVFAAGLVIAYLIRFQGMRIERDGSGMRPMLSFYKPDEHMAAIAQNRAAVPVERAASSEPIATGTEPPLVKQTPVEKPYWTDFRGPRRDGRYDETPVLANWPQQGPPRLWRKPLGGGYASFVFGNGKAFTIEQRREQETVAAYDVKTGREVWSHGWNVAFRESMGGDGPRATPAWDEGRVYALGAAGELRCLDGQSGRRIWSKNILEENDAQNLPWGMAASPLVVGDMLIVLPGGTSGKSVVAYNKITGDPIWKALDDKQAYVSPMLVTLADQRQILIVSATRAVGLTFDGKLLWEYPWSTSYDINAAQPVIVDTDRFILSSGYGHGSAMVRVSRIGGAFTATRVWENTRMKNKFSSSVLHDGYIYGLDEAILACVNVDTGDLKWKGGRYGYGQIVLAGDNIIVAAEDGDAALVRATPERYEELVRFRAIEGKTWSHPAISQGLLLLRNTTEMSAFRLN